MEACTHGATCRLCWDEEQPGSGGQLLSPCSCTGSMGLVHRSCLYTWQQQVLRNGGSRGSLRCEVCKQRYTVLPSATWLGPAERAHNAALATFGCQSMQDLVVRQLHHYALVRALASGAASALQPSLQGLKVGLAFGGCVMAQRLLLLLAGVCSGGATRARRQPADSRAPLPLLLQAAFAPVGGLVLGGLWTFIGGFKQGYVGGVCAALGLGGRLAGAAGGLLAGGLRLLLRRP